jgi:hypothetical protein
MFVKYGFLDLILSRKTQINIERNTLSCHPQPSSAASVQNYNDDILVVFSLFLYVRTFPESPKSMGSIQRKRNCGKGLRDIK